MSLTRRSIGELVSPIDERNDIGLHNFCGLNKDKSFIQTAAKTAGLDASKYKVIRYGRFAFSGMQTGRDRCIRLSLSREEKPFLVSPAYTTFEVNDREILPEYLFMFFNSEEKDRLGWFLSDGSIRANLDWETFCEIDIELPSLDIQAKYVAIYEAMLANQRSHEQSLDDIKLTCDAYIEELTREYPSTFIGSYIEQKDLRNNEGFEEQYVRGISVDKQLIKTKAKLDGVNLHNYKIVNPYDLVYVADTSRRGGKISLALNESDTPCIVSPISTVFSVKDPGKLLPEYLMLFFSRSEFDRYARFSSWGSARETFDWDEMCSVRIPIPDTTIQNYAVQLYRAWRSRMAANEQLKTQLKDICPILIRGSIEEASR